MLTKIARFSVRHKRVVVFGIWIPAAIIIAIISGITGSAFSTSMDLPESESRDVINILEQVNPQQAGGSAQIVFSSSIGFKDPALQKSINDVLAKVDAITDVDVAGPFATPGQVSQNGKIAFARVETKQMTVEEMASLAEDIEAVVDPLKSGSLQIEYGGELFGTFETPESEVLGLLAAMIILVLAFGSVLAMGLPIGIALIGLVMAVSIVGLASHLASMPDAVTSMVGMIGLGVGIDYALFIVTRFRESLHDGLSVEDAVVEAIDTSGRAVIFAAITVIIALLGLLAIGLPFVSGLAIGMAISVAVMMIAAVSLLPSLIAMAGERVDNTTRAAMISLVVFVVSALIGFFSGIIAFFQAGVLIAALVQVARFFVKPLRTPLPHRAQNNHQESFWWRWSRMIQRRPWVSLLASLVILCTFAIPMFSMRLGFGDAGNAAKDTTTRKAYDLIAEGFGPGFSGPLLITVDGADKQQLGAFVQKLNSTEGIAMAMPIPVKSETISLVMLYPKTAPQDEATTTLVHTLRDEVIPSANVNAKVGGWTAGQVDFADYLSQRLPLLIAIVLILSFILLMAVFRSVLVPLKAVFMNLLSVGAAYGVIVAVFQWGWFGSIIGIDKPGPVEAWAPMFLFAIVFGLSMDYEVFLLSRMKEEFDRTGDNTTAVADGVAATARVITAAALIMVCVFAAFVLGDDRQLKLFGLGMAFAVFIDATVVRMLLVPATMELLGDRNWWIPKWIDRVLPSIDVEGHHHEYPPVKH
jgi:putative drug exporter of the RND superfamily